MLTPEYLYRITEGAEDIASQLHKNILDKIIARMMARIGRGEDYLLTATDKWQIEVLQEAGYLLEDIQKELSDKTKKQVQEIKEGMSFSFGDITYNYQEDMANWWKYRIQGDVPPWMYYVKFEKMSEEEAKKMIEEAQPKEDTLFNKFKEE